MNIIANFGSSVSVAPAAYLTAIQSAISYLDQLIINPISVNLTFGWGEVNGAAIPSGAAGENQSSGMLFGYSAVRAALAAAATSSDDKASVATLSAADPTSGGSFFVTSPEAQVLGLSGPTNAVAGYVGLNSAYSYTFDAAVRGMAGKLDAIGIIEHEITEVLGRIGSLGANGWHTPFDLFRFSSAGVHHLSPGAGYFSVDGQSMLLPFNNPQFGGDAADWSSSVHGDSFGPVSAGVVGAISATDLRSLDLLGYTLSTNSSSSTPVQPALPAPVSASPPAAPAPAPPPPLPGGGKVFTASTTPATLTGGAGDDTLNASQGPDVLTGGPGADRFVFHLEPWAPAHIKDFAVGVDTLDITPLFQNIGYIGSDPVHDGIVRLFDDGAGGTEVFFANPAHQWPNNIIDIERVPLGSATWAQISGDAPPLPVSPPPPPIPSPPPTGSGVTLQGQDGGSSLVGELGTDTLIGGSSGPDTMTGGGGADHFQFNSVPWQGDLITDFAHGVDKIDVSRLLASVGYAGTDPIADGYIRYGADGEGNTYVYFDRDGHGISDMWGTRVATIQHVDPTTITTGDWIFH